MFVFVAKAKRARKKIFLSLQLNLKAYQYNETRMFKHIYAHIFYTSVSSHALLMNVYLKICSFVCTYK